MFLIKNLLSPIYNIQKLINYNVLTPLSGFNAEKKYFSIDVKEMETITRFHIEDGKFKGCDDIPKRFKRLDWGIWIRRKAGWSKRRWKMNNRQKLRSLYHVFCRGSLSKKLDLMAGKDFIREKYYVNDPYESYHKRNFNGPLPRAVSSYSKHILNQHYQTDIY